MQAFEYSLWEKPVSMLEPDFLIPPCCEEPKKPRVKGYQPASRYSIQPERHGRKESIVDINVGLLSKRLQSQLQPCRNFKWKTTIAKPNNSQNLRDNIINKVFKWLSFRMLGYTAVGTAFVTFFNEPACLISLNGAWTTETNSLFREINVKVCFGVIEQNYKILLCNLHKHWF